MVHLNEDLVPTDTVLISLISVIVGTKKLFFNASYGVIEKPPASEH